MKKNFSTILDGVDVFNIPTSQLTGAQAAHLQEVTSAYLNTPGDWSEKDSVVEKTMRKIERKIAEAARPAKIGRPAE
jgi:hypothetical protein